MDTVNGEKWIVEYARWIRNHESKLGDAARKALNTNNATMTWAFWSLVTLGAAVNPDPKAIRSSNAPAPRSMTLKLNPHYLYYLLIRFEALGLPVGQLDIKIPTSARPTSYFSFVSATTNRDKDDTISMSSFRSRMSAVSSSFSIGSSWWSFTAEKPDPTKDLKYIYSALTKISSIRLGPIPVTQLIQDFEDFPGQSAVPLDVLKNLQSLELEDVDPRTLLGWDRVSMQLRSLTCRKSGVEDLTDLIIDLVLDNAKRRRGERVKPTSKRRPASASGGTTVTESESDTGTETPMGGESPLTSPPLPPELPSLSWHFLRYLNLSNNSLTFIPSMPLRALQGLTNLDLSSNLLNVVPPSLCHLPNLTLLNMSDNLVDSVLGIYDTLKCIRVLNLARNRLESLCGLERLYTLERIDLRTNCVYEAGEVGRLATVPSIREVWIKENPLEDELLDYRVECFVEFAKEARAVTLDGEGAGYFERQRVAERVPNASMHTLRPTEDETETRRNNVVVKSVKHHGSVVNRKAAREHRRVVDLENTPRKDKGKEPETTEAEDVVQAVRDGDNEAAMSVRRPISILVDQDTPASPTKGGTLGRSSNFRTSRPNASQQARVTTSLYKPDLAESNRPEALRRRIEALKGEVGDDWLRLLSQGDEAPKKAKGRKKSSNSHIIPTHEPH